MEVRELTPEQKALMPAIRDEWIEIGLNTLSSDKQKAEDAINLAYKCAEFQPPSRIIWFDNPGQAATWIISNIDDTWRETCRDNWLELKKQFWYGTPTTWRVSSAIESKVNENIYVPVLGTIEMAVDLPVEDSIDRAVKAIRGWSRGSRIVPNSIGSDCPFTYSNHLANCAYYAYFEAIGLDCSRYRGLWATAKHCGWWWAFKDVAVVTPKPSAIHFSYSSGL